MIRESKALCHSDRSIAIGFINRNAKRRNLLFLAVPRTRLAGH
jgi:hypothetical protein